MSKKVYIAEKPSVAKAFGEALAHAYHYDYRKVDGYWESDEAIITWCVGHLVTMSYPEVYDEKYKKWSLETIPFIPEQFRYEVIEDVRKQFNPRLSFQRFQPVFVIENRIHLRQKD